MPKDSSKADIYILGWDDSAMEDSASRMGYDDNFEGIHKDNLYKNLRQSLKVEKLDGTAWDRLMNTMEEVTDIFTNRLNKLARKDTGEYELDEVEVNLSISASGGAAVVIGVFEASIDSEREKGFTLKFRRRKSKRGLLG